MWRSADPIDAYGLNHLASVAGDALLAISLSDSVFFSVPVGQARLRVTAYLALTMLPLALAGPLIAPILDRAGPRRSITFGAAAARAVLAMLLAPRLARNWLFPLALAILVLLEGAHDREERAHDGLRLEAGRPDAGERASRPGRGGGRGRGDAARASSRSRRSIRPAPLYVAAAIYADVGAP